jgi:hypothetical protein
MYSSTAARATRITTCRKVENGFRAFAMLDSTFAAALFAGTDVLKEFWRFPTMTAATATTTIANTAAIARDF